MKFIPRQLQLRQEWEHVVQHSDEAWFFHQFDWLEVTQSHWPLEDKSFLVEYEGKIVGIFPLQLNKHSKSLKSTYMGMGGPALMTGLAEGIRKKILKGMHAQVRSIADEQASPFIEILVSPLSFASLENRWQVNDLLAFGYEDASTHSWVMDLASGDIHYSDDAVHSIATATQKGYTVQRLTDVAGVDALYQVHCENRQRTGAPTHPKDFFKGVVERFCVKNSAIIWQAMDAQGQLAAFQVTAVFGNGAYYWMGSCKNEHLSHGVNYLLQDHSIRWAKEQGFQWYENGEAFPGLTSGKAHGLSLFKGKFGGQLHRFFKGKIISNRPGPIRRLAAVITQAFAKQDKAW